MTTTQNTEATALALNLVTEARNYIEAQAKWNDKTDAVKTSMAYSLAAKFINYGGMFA